MYYAAFLLLCILHGIKTSIAGNIRDYRDGAIVYPGPTKRPSKNPVNHPTTEESLFNRQSFHPDEDKYIPDECKKQGFCTIKPRNYPQEKYNSLFNGLTFVPQPAPEIEDNRQGDPDEKDGCDSTVTFEPLYKVKSMKDEWRTVIQSPDNNFVQKVRLETCRNPGGSCFTILPHVPNFVISCKQKYNIWELLVEGENGPETIKADLPVCCSCVYRTSEVGDR